MYLSKFQFAKPRHRSLQTDLLSRLIRFASNHPDIGPARAEAFISRFGVKPPAVEHRYHEPPDYSDPLFTKNPEGSSLSAKVKFYSERSTDALRELTREMATPPDHLIHVTCTGYVSPSPIQTLILEKKWQRTQHQHLYHMGCYASLPAIRSAYGEALRLATHKSSPRIDIFQSEICSLHLNLDDFGPEQIVIQTLFADGHIYYSLSPDRPSLGFEVLALHEIMAPNSSDLMTWAIDDPSFSMKLSRQVPDAIVPHLPQLRAELVEKSTQSIDLSSLVYAIHPGGPKIIDRVAEAWELLPNQTEHSRSVLREHGNMSSVTLPRVWMNMLEDPGIPSGTPILSVAFGPGLTLFGAILRKLAP